MKKTMLLAALAALLTTTLFAQGPQLPPGKWWDRPEVVRVLALTEEQRTKLDDIFRAAANGLIDARADVEKANVALRGELDQPQVNRGNLQRLARQLNEARGRLFEREVMMFADMRGVLSQTQWSRLRSEMERRRDQPPQQRRQRPQ
jgi:hypothetical protein